MAVCGVVGRGMWLAGKKEDRPSQRSASTLVSVSLDPGAILLVQQRTMYHNDGSNNDDNIGLMLLFIIIIIVVVVIKRWNEYRPKPRT